MTALDVAWWVVFRAPLALGLLVLAFMVAADAAEWLRYVASDRR